MSSTHTAIYSPMPLSREEAIERVMFTLEARGAVFDGGLRGMHWDAGLNSFAYDEEEDHDLEGLLSVEAAIARSQGFELTALDLRFLHTSVEAQALTGKESRQVRLAFSSSLHRLAQSDATIADRWLDALVAVADALEVLQMLCGTAMEDRRYTAAELTSSLEQHLRSFTVGSLSVHSAILSARQLEELNRHRTVPPEFSSNPLGSGRVLLTSLPKSKR